MAPVPSHVKTPLPTIGGAPSSILPCWVRTASQSLMCVVEYTSREVRARTSSYGTLCFAYVGDGRSVYVLGRVPCGLSNCGIPKCVCPALKGESILWNALSQEGAAHGFVRHHLFDVTFQDDCADLQDIDVVGELFWRSGPHSVLREAP